MKAAWLRVVVSCLVLAAGHPVTAQVIAVFTDPNGESIGCTAVHADQFIDLYVIIKPVLPEEPLGLSYVEFQDPAFSFQGSGILPFDYTYNFPPADNFGGFKFNFGGCLDTPIHVLTIHAYCYATPPACRTLWIDPIEMRNCAGNPTPSYGGSGFSYIRLDATCSLSPPTNVYPPDGATHVPLNAVLQWGEMVGANRCYGPDHFGIRLGTSPNGPILDNTIGELSWDPTGLLQDNTTYYWSVTGFRVGVAQVESSTWTFSTGEAPVATQRSTWGRIKALYR